MKTNHTRPEESLLIRTLGDNPKLRIVDFLIDNVLFDFSKKEMIEGSGISRPTFNKYFDDLEKQGIVKVSRKFGGTKLYQLNKDSPVVKAILELDNDLSQAYADKIEKGEKERVYA